MSPNLQNSVLLRQTDDRQVAAAESEDFALAERLNEELERYQLELETMSETVDTLVRETIGALQLNCFLSFFLAE